MTTFVHKQIESARSGRAADLVCRVPSGWVFLFDKQFLRGYCILSADPVVPSLNDLSKPQRAEYLSDMALIGDALLEVTGAYRINYAILGNQDPALHAHIIPRFADEPDELKRGLPWSYPREQMDALSFDPERDGEFILALARAIKSRYEA